MTFFLAILLAIGNSIWGGYVLTILWAWFVAPTFGLPNLSIPIAIGLVIIKNTLFVSMEKKNDDEDGITKVIYHAVYLAVALGTGWVVHQFV